MLKWTTQVKEKSKNVFLECSRAVVSEGCLRSFIFPPFHQTPLLFLHRVIAVREYGLRSCLGSNATND